MDKTTGNTEIYDSFIHKKFDELEIIAKVPKRNYLRRMAGYLFTFYSITLLPVVLNFNAFRIFAFHSTSSILWCIPFFSLIYIVFPLFLSLRRYRYYIVEMAIDNDALYISYLDKIKPGYLKIEFTNLRMALFNVGAGPMVYRLNFYDKNKLKVYQVEGVNWSRYLIKKVYQELQKHCLESTTAFKI